MEWQHNCLYRMFQVRYRVINLADDKGDDAVVTLSHIHQQHEAVRQAFRPYNITWLLDVIQVNNTFLRHRHVLVTCEPHQVGNGYCEDDCRHSMTFDDAGDCNITRIACDVSRLGNGQCDVECNRARHHWDGGDCCDKLSLDIWPTCLDPGSSVRYIIFNKLVNHSNKYFTSKLQTSNVFVRYRAYISVRELKSAVNISNNDALNVYLTSWNDRHLVGMATFPWEADVFTVQGCRYTTVNLLLNCVQEQLMML